MVKAINKVFAAGVVMIAVLLLNACTMGPVIPEDFVGEGPMTLHEAHELLANLGGGRPTFDFEFTTSGFSTHSVNSITEKNGVVTVHYENQTKQYKLSSFKSIKVTYNGGIIPAQFSLDGGSTSIYILGDKAEDNDAELKRICSAILFLKQYRNPERAAKDKERFEQAVLGVRDGTVKQIMTQSLHRTQVLAGAAVHDKHFQLAADYYEEALEQSPWWAVGHFNRALILGEMQSYKDAIGEMKRYLALAPSAKNAQSAQDQIYRWEEKITN